MDKVIEKIAIQWLQEEVAPHILTASTNFTLGDYFREHAAIVRLIDAIARSPEDPRTLLTIANSRTVEGCVFGSDTIEARLEKAREIVAYLAPFSAVGKGGER